MRLSAALALVGTVGLASAAQASVLDIYGFNPRGTSMGNAQAAVADDYTATFYNPGALTRRKKVNVGAGFVATFPKLSVDRELASSRIPNETPPDFAGFNLGATFPLGGRIENRVALGIAAYVPTLNFVRGEGVDSQVPQFYLYQNLPDKFVILAAGAFEIVEGFSIGMGAQVLAGLDGAVALDLDVANNRVGQRSVNVKVYPSMAPVVGIHAQPLDELNLGASWRGSLKLDYSLPASISVGDLLALDLDIGGTVLYSPHVFNLGAAWDFRSLDLLLAGEVSYVLWSKAPDPSPRFTVDIQGELIEGLGLGDRLDIGNGAPVDLRFRDTPVVKLGLEHKPNDSFAVRTGYTWRPSPAPVPTETFNYIDNDAHIVAVGGGVTFLDPLEIHKSPMTIDLVYQATIMTEQHVAKTAGDKDLVGDYTAGGIIHSIGISMRHDL